jgi:hypothetical protein
MKIYQSTGLITVVPTRVDFGIGNPFADEEFRAKYTSLMLEARKKGIPINGL